MSNKKNDNDNNKNNNNKKNYKKINNNNRKNAGDPPHWTGLGRAARECKVIVDRPTYFHFDILFVSTYKYKRHSRAICW